MYQCEMCGETFEKPEEWTEQQGWYQNERYYEYFKGCPYCHNTGYEKINEGEEI